jgi:bifunctional non-homologous end joining protein LigD
MQPVDAKYPRQHYIDDASYLGQAKKNGRRMVAFGNGDMVSYQSRSTKVWSAPNVKLHSYLTTLTKEIGPFIIDGELLYYSFDGSEHRTGAQAAIVNMNAGQGHIQPVCEYALFECLYYSGVDLTTTAKLDRIETLGELVFELRKIDPDNQAHAVALQTFYTQEEKAFLANYQKTHHCEGEVWTHKYATYTGGKDLKNEVVLRTKYKIDIKAVIMGLTPTTADGRPFGAIEVGVVEAGHVKPIGSVGTGYTVAQMWDICHKVNGSLPLTVYIDIKSEGYTEYGQVSQGTFEGFADEEE